MIAMLSGKLRLREPGRLILATGGVGYEVFVPLSTYYRMPSVGAEVELEIRQDLIADDAGQTAWAELLARLFREASTRFPS